jgi:hypothetical protein
MASLIFPQCTTTKHRWTKLIATLLVLSLIPGAKANNIEIDYNAQVSNLTLAAAARVATINIVSININRQFASIFDIDRLMNTKKWDVVLIQETGVVKNDQCGAVATHKMICCRLVNHIKFNSPKQTRLNDKRRRRKEAKLRLKLNKEQINNEQFNTQMKYLPNDHADPAGGMAIMTRPEITKQILHHKVSSTNKEGARYRNARIMVALFKINDCNVILLNVYGPTKTEAKKSWWFTNKLCPVAMEATCNGWDLIIGGDFNAM